jgi:hypothetical protein
MMFRKVSSTRLSAAAAMLVLLPVAHEVPAYGALAIAAGVLAALNIVEYVRVTRDLKASAAIAAVNQANVP